MSLSEETISLPSTSGKGSINLHTLFSIPSSSTTTTKPALLCLHFWGGSNRTFLPFISELSKTNDIAIIAPSLRGWGKSSKPADPEGYHISDFVDDIVALVAHLRTHRSALLQNGLVILGHSMGGKIAQLLPTRPEVAELVKGVVLIAPAPSASFRLPEEMRQVQIKAYESEESARGAVTSVLLGYPGAVGDDEVDALVADAVAGSAEAKAAWPLYGMSEDFEADVRKGVASRGDTQPRVLVVVGELDRVEPETAVRGRVAKVLEDAGAWVEMEKLEGVGHLVPVEAPGLVGNRVDAFLNGLG